MSRQFKTLLAGGALGFVALLVVAFIVGSIYAQSKAAKMLDVAVAQAEESLTDGADNILTFIGAAVVRAYDSPHDATPRQIDLYKQALAVDELGIVDENGRFVYSTEPDALPGQEFNFAATNRLRDYSVLLKGTRCVIEPVRGSVEHPELRRKYGGVAFPGNKGFVQIGFDEKRLIDDFDYYYDNLAVDWKFGESGYYILADPATGRIISTCDPANVGKYLSAAVPDLAFSGRVSGKMKQLHCFGELCYVRDFTSNGHRVLTVLPATEVCELRAMFVLMTAAVSLILMAVCLYVFRQVEQRNMNERLQALKDMRMAKNIQQNALPTIFPPFPLLTCRIDLFATMRTAKEVGGDFYDFYFAGADKLALVIADVSGKGVPAAMFMMRAKTTLQGLLRGGGDVAEIVSRVNRRLSSGNEANMFVTAWIGVVDLVTGVVEYVNAGHNPPAVRHGSGEWEWLRERSGPPLASFEGLIYRKHEFRLKPGDGIFLYTDGVTEATDANQALFGDARLMQTLQAASAKAPGAVGPSSSGLCADVITDLDRFVNGSEQADDITMLSFVLKGVERSFPATDVGLRDTQPYLAMFQEDPKPAIIMDEIVSNIVRCSGAHMFSVRFTLKAEGLEMMFIDDGVAFDPTVQIGEPDLSADVMDRSIGGLGMFMVKKMSRSVAYRRTPEGKNELSVLL